MSLADDTELARLLCVRAARETGLLAAYLESAGTPAEAAAAADVTEPSARVTGRVLAEMGVLRRIDGEYEPTNGALGLLTKRDPRSVGDLPHRLDVLDTLVALPETMETGVPPTLPDDWNDNQVGAGETVSEATRRAVVTAALRSHPEAASVVDVCGGAGAYAAEFRERGLEATLVESSEVIEAVRPLAESRGLDVFAGPVSELNWTFDIGFLADDVTAMRETEAAATVEALAEYVADDGRLVVVDRFEGPAATAAAVRSLAAGNGDVPAPETVGDWLRAAGFDTVDHEPVPGTDRVAIVGSRA
ncbi:SAM-dependent methyltransferase [Halobaculum sp. MBLA0143]|uniref:SAM-dependent methyltransferase n=1 Tax=Halobaculum sp. MBLA0143 TaxID=3079933 RepID=UPI0035236F7C